MTAWAQAQLASYPQLGRLLEAVWRYNAFLLGAATIVVLSRLKNFILRIVIVCLAGFWLLVRGYDAFMNSDYSKYDTKIQHKSAHGY